MPELKHANEMLHVLPKKAKSVMLFLDFDGTLSPIVKIPSDAVILPDNKKAILELQKQMPIYIVSGRKLDDVKARIIGSNEQMNLCFAGSHGFEMELSDGKRISKADEFRPFLESAFDGLTELVGKIDGVILENNKYSLSVHYRLVSNEKEVDSIFEKVKQFIDPKYKDHLKLTFGKKVIEVRPKLNWHKGRAVSYILEQHQEDLFPIYVGDDLTDEDAFDVVRNGGLAVLVSPQSDQTRHEQSKANCFLNSPEEVAVWLSKIHTFYK